MRDATCADCAAVFAFGGRGPLPERCPPCHAAHRSAYLRAWRLAHPERIASYTKRRGSGEEETK